MKTILIILATLVWSTVCCAEDQKIYTNQDLKKYGSDSEKKPEKGIGSFCDIFWTKWEKCDQNDLKCKLYFIKQYDDCINPPVKVRVVP
ncbi:MAG: hypothetical protein ACLPX5_02145 [Dissulfurispiraceae bacterium]